MSIRSPAQVLSGLIKDDKGAPLPGTTITIVENTSQRIISFSTAGNDGKYKISIPPANTELTKLLIQVRILGYKKESMSIQQGLLIYDFTLSIDPAQLPDLIVTDKHPRLKIHGDTTSYNVSDFTNPQDRTIGDVLKRMPGVEVDRTGKIYYNGKAISRFYIDGDNLLDDQYNIGTTSIPNMVVDKVQILENHEPIAMRRENSNNTSTALNITLKNGVSQKPIDQVKLGGGYPNLYYGALTNLLFKKQYKSINQLKADNTGIDFTNDLTSYDNASFEGKIGISNSDPLLSASTIGYPSIEQSRYLFNNTGILNTNNLIKLKNNLQLKLKVNCLYDKEIQKYQNSTEVLLNMDSVLYNQHLANTITPLKLKVELNLNENEKFHYFDNTIRLQYDKNLENASLFTNGSALSQYLKTNLIQFSNELTLIKKLKGISSIEIFSYISDGKYPQTLTISPSYYPSGFNFPDTLSTLMQKVTFPTFYTNNYLAINIPSTITQNYKLGASFQSQQLSTQLSGKASNSNQELLADSAQNDVHWERNKIYAEASYHYNTKSKNIAINIRAPLVFQRTNISNSSFEQNTSISNLFFTPELTIILDPVNENIFNLRYQYADDPGTIEKFYSGYILKDYRTIEANNAPYNISKQTFNLGYTFRKSAKLFFLNFNAGYTLQNSNTIPFSNIGDNFTITNYIASLDNKSYGWDLSSGASKYIFKLRTTISGSYFWQYKKSNQYFNNALLPYANYSQIITLVVDSKINKQIFLKYSCQYFHYKGEPAISHLDIPTQTVKRINQDIEFTYLPIESIYLKVGLEDLYSPVVNVKQINSLFADASIQYKLNKLHADVELSLLNITNINNYNITALTVNSISATSYPLRGRTGLLSMTFNF